MKSEMPVCFPALRLAKSLGRRLKKLFGKAPPPPPRSDVATIGSSGRSYCFLDQNTMEGDMPTWHSGIFLPPPPPAHKVYQGHDWSLRALPSIRRSPIPGCGNGAQNRPSAFRHHQPESLPQPFKTTQFSSNSEEASTPLAKGQPAPNETHLQAASGQSGHYVVERALERRTAMCEKMRCVSNPKDACQTDKKPFRDDESMVSGAPNCAGKSKSATSAFAECPPTPTIVQCPINDHDVEQKHCTTTDPDHGDQSKSKPHICPEVSLPATSMAAPSLALGVAQQAAAPISIASPVKKPLRMASGVPPPPPLRAAPKGIPPPPPRRLKTMLQIRHQSSVVDTFQKYVRGGKQLAASTKPAKITTMTSIGLIDELESRSPYKKKIQEEIVTSQAMLQDLAEKIRTKKHTKMSDLISFVDNVNSELAKLTDEGQVLRSFESWPTERYEQMQESVKLFQDLMEMKKRFFISKRLSSWQTGLRTVAEDLNGMEKLTTASIQKIDKMQQQEVQLAEKFSKAGLPWKNGIWKEVRISSLTLLSIYLTVALSRAKGDVASSTRVALLKGT
ncbi:hypothetical protein BSKO_13051 [Bryopsis sp. KO-2023]|nr:hypothetical protein BSKO_13051 [Bryopsis sp. KO-2023]